MKFCIPLNAGLRLLAGVLLLMTSSPADEGLTLNGESDGYRGIWYQNQPLKGEYRFKYSGGLGTYCAKHMPFAVHCAEVNKTFFCYGGVPEGYHHRRELTEGRVGARATEDALYHMVSFFDHEEGVLARPTVLLDKRTYDAHDNPVISVDDTGHVWIFSTAHGNMRPAYVHKSKRPYDVSEFSRVEPYLSTGKNRIPVTNFSYMQVWNVRERGFIFFFTKYEGSHRETCFAASKDGVQWSDWSQLADIEEGHYQVSGVTGGKAACSFNYHPRAFGGDPKRKGLNWRTNLYYMETPDFGKTWRAADGSLLETPVTKPRNPALVRDFEKEGLLVYMKDLMFDEEGHPVILFVTSRGYKPGPESGSRVWRIARWSGREWAIHDITSSDSNYDMGSLYLESDGSLKVIAPTEAGPQPGNPGGEVAIWNSVDGGETWRKHRQITGGSEYNHTYVRRPVNAHEDFYAFWADGHGRKPSPSRLYFCNRQGDVVRMPNLMKGRRQAPAGVIQPEDLDLSEAPDTDNPCR